jgi:hypothetical protein
MVNILDLLAEQKSKAKFLKTKDDARDYFVKQKSSILNISNTE